MISTPYFILILFYAGFLGSIVVVNIAVVTVVRLLVSFWTWQRNQSEQLERVPARMVAHAS